MPAVRETASVAAAVINCFISLNRLSARNKKKGGWLPHKVRERKNSDSLTRIGILFYKKKGVCR